MATPIPPNRSRWSQDDLIRATGGSLGPVGTHPRVHVGASSDSRAVTPGGLFVALRGENMDGHRFLPAAVANRAGALVVEPGRVVPKGDLDVITVSDTLIAWGDLGAFHLRRWCRLGGGRRVVGITGSAGKTTTKELTAALLGAVGRCHATAGNLNNRIGVPAVALATPDESDFAVFEMGMSVPGEIARLTEIVAPDVALITNIGVAHSLGLGGHQGVAAEKGALFAGLREDATAVVNADDSAVKQQLQRLRSRNVVTFGVAAEADYRLVSVDPGEAGVRVGVLRRAAGGRPLEREEIQVALPLVGRMNALNFLAALASADAAAGRHLSGSEIETALSVVSIPAGRSSVIQLGRGVTVIDDTYNSNPTSMEAALEVLATECTRGGHARRGIVVFGDMLELGDDAVREHQRIATLISDGRAAIAVGCGEMASRALRDVPSNLMDIHLTDTSDRAATLLPPLLRDGDVVLVKGSRGVRTERVVAELTGTLGARHPGEVR